MSKNEHILVQDDYKIFDRLIEQQKLTPKIGPIGWVRAYIQKKNEEKKLFFEGQNMIVAQGRNFVAQKIFSLAETGNDLRDYKISHFSVGSGGASVSGDDVTLLGPHICDTYLNKPIGLGSTHNEPGVYDNSALSDELKDLYTSYGAVKPIDSITLVTEEYDETGITCSYKTKVKCECTVIVTGKQIGRAHV